MSKLSKTSKKINDSDCKHLKIQVGRRFKAFRENIGKTQTQLAEELGVYQSSITNMEVGKTFPGIKYLQHFSNLYGLDMNWILCGIGEMYHKVNRRPEPPVKVKETHRELFRLLDIPFVEQIILGKLAELKMLAGDRIKALKTQKSA